MTTLPYSETPERYMRTLRALIEASHQVQAISSRHIESMGLTPAQFDVLATLGDTPGMTCKQLGAGTLITKGTLTGVLDRLEAKRLVSRSRGEQDTRQMFVSLTREGEQVFGQTFQPHVDFLGRFFNRMAADRQLLLIELLRELQAAFETENEASLTGGSN